MSIGLLGKKIGMTRLYDEKGRVTPATVIEAGGNRILQVKTADKDGYAAVQVGYGDQKPQRVGKAMTGHFAKSSSTPKRFIREFRLVDGAASPESGDLPVTGFEVGQFVDVIGQSKGKGFQGVVKRHGFHGGPRSHGQKHSEREPGAIGGSGGRAGGRVAKGIRMAGRMGGDQVTTQNLTVHAVDAEKGLILIKGAIPGPQGGLVVVKSSAKGK